ncbi:MAG: hydantoinase B/oxoprolinase family protein [Candidatus Rokubacteria bacterium]|nr:hydantoinase B/oxoprolinase family protein [Candidatus Rokubacteria bacterium]
MGRRFDPITTEILWQRLIALVDEASINLVRSSFSTAVREANDYACVLMDARGDAVAQASVSVPSFICTLPISVKHFLRRFPPASLSPGDVLISNDPWMCNGHLPDVNLAAPIFMGRRLVGFAGAGAHWPDVGGNQYSAESRSVFEEGLRIPICKIVERGRENPVVIDFIRNNVNVPDRVLGDMRAQLAALRAMSDGLVRLVREYRLADFGPLAAHIQQLAEAEMRREIRKIPNGRYQGSVETDGFDAPLRLVATVAVEGAKLMVDYTGTSPQTERGLNSVPNFTYAYTAYTLKCLLAPHTPNNEGSFRPISVTAPLGSVLNPRFPAPVNGRTMSGHFLHAPIFKALAAVLPDRVMGESGGCPIWGPMWAGTHRGERFTHLHSANGGLGASVSRDGVSCLPFPSNVPNTPVEITEAAAPLLVECKALRQDSAGAGEYRGGLGQVVAIRVTAAQPVTAALRCDRTRRPAEGLHGGQPGATGRVLINGAVNADPKAKMRLQPGDVLTMETPGGGGFGDPRKRDRGAVEADLRNGLISESAARDIYGLAASPGDP